MSPTKDLVDLAQRFDADRRHLRSVAFGLLGSLADADDAVQSAWLQASHADVSAINNVDNLTGWFTTITARVALDQLRLRKRRAEQPLDDTGDWGAALDGFGEAVPADEDTLLAESVSRALLVVLDRLSPAQRVAFVLHDVFAVPFDAIADLLNRSPEAAKKLASRARGRLQADATAKPRRAAEHLEVVEAFLAASRGGDIARLLELLAPGVVRRVDRALVGEDVPTELHGAEVVAEETRRFTQRVRTGAVMLIDGVPGIVLAPRGRAQVLLLIGIGAENRIDTIDITGDAERIRRAALALPRRPVQQPLLVLSSISPVGYQGRRAPSPGPSDRGQDREHHAG